MTPQLSTVFVNQQQREMEEQQQTWCESLPSFQGKLLVVSGCWVCSNENAFLKFVSYGVMPCHNYTYYKCNLPTPPFAAPVRVSEADHYRDGWSVDPPNTQGTIA